ncbi:DUF4296 domain-containing protein [uncultured Prevotella sp.]|uniref:DUF4296 domain-containing protein n=1 Tax=uncultured Prevotella sp. TaxID=159272 RepID=UPI002601669A|nr:DUF4296 domain-containing protein [uncultured Prevotella sp.]
MTNTINVAKMAGLYCRLRLLAACLVLFMTVVLTGCKPGIPGRYLQMDEMVDILYDYHVADGMVQTNFDSPDSVAMRAYRISILKNHGVTQADFDSSMVYYTRHTRLLQKVYDKIADRLDREAVERGGQAGFTDLTENADTTNVWKRSTAFVLSPYLATNRMSFEIKADSSYHEGDRMVLDFDAQFLYQDGMRDALVVLAITYANDSVEYVNNSISTSSHYHMQIMNEGRLAIKSVRGFWMLSSDRAMPTSSATTFKLFIVSNVRLVKMHVTEPVKKPEDGNMSPDSLELPKIDSLDRRRPINLNDRKL